MRFAARINRAGYRGGKALFTQIANHVGNVLRGRIGQPLRHALAAGGVHAHVQRAFKPEAEAPPGLIELRRADP